MLHAEQYVRSVRSFATMSKSGAMVRRELGQSTSDQLPDWCSTQLRNAQHTSKSISLLWPATVNDCSAANHWSGDHAGTRRIWTMATNDRTATAATAHNNDDNHRTPDHRTNCSLRGRTVLRPEREEWHLPKYSRVSAHIEPICGASEGPRLHRIHSRIERSVQLWAAEYLLHERGTGVRTTEIRRSCCKPSTPTDARGRLWLLKHHIDPCCWRPASQKRWFYQNLCVYYSKRLNVHFTVNCFRRLALDGVDRLHKQFEWIELEMWRHIDHDATCLDCSSLH